MNVPMRKSFVPDFPFVPVDWKNSENIARDIAHVIVYAMAMTGTKGRASCLDIMPDTPRSDIHSYLNDPWNTFLQKFERNGGGG